MSIKTGLLLLLPALLLVGESRAANSVISLSEPVAQDAHSRTFGSFIQPTLPRVTVSELMLHPERYTAQPFLLQAQIAQICQKKGCFFMVAEDDAMLRVTFREYGFFIPTDSSGKTVTLTGTLVGQHRSQAQVEHFLQDMGDNPAVLTPGKVYEIVADAVRVPNS